VTSHDNCLKVVSTSQEINSGTLIGTYTTKNTCSTSPLSTLYLIIIIVVGALVMLLVVLIVVVLKVPNLRQKLLPYRDDRPEDTVAMRLRNESPSMNSRTVA